MGDPDKDAIALRFDIANMQSEDPVEAEFLAALNSTKEVLYDWGSDVLEAGGHEIPATSFLKIAGMREISAEDLARALNNSGLELSHSDS